MKRPRRSLKAPFVCALVLLGLAVPTGAAGAATTASGPLAPELVQLQAAAAEGAAADSQSEAAGLPTEGPGSIVREGDRVIVEARFRGGAPARVGALEAAGAEVLSASRRYQSAALSVAPEDLAAVGEVPGLEVVAPAREPTFYGAEETLGTAAIESNGLCEGGSVISQGVTQLNVPAARAAFGARGKGLTIGVISDSFNSATTSIEGGPPASTAHGDEVSNDLPGPAGTCSGQQMKVNVVAEAPPPGAGEDARTDEGRAMLQVIHDIAPHAQLAFATAYSTEMQFAEHIRLLAKPVAAGGAGADVIVDDVGYFEEPFYQDGPVAVAIKEVTELGVTYLTAAGNENSVNASGQPIASWEAPAYRPMACPSELTVLGVVGPTCMDFDPTSGENAKFEMKVKAGGTAIFDLQWAEPWFGVDTDLDAYLFDKNGNLLTEAGEGQADNVVLGKPIELFGWQNETAESQTIHLVIDRCTGACNPTAANGTPRLKVVQLGRGAVTEIQYHGTNGDKVGPTIYGHAGAAAAITLAAVKDTESATAPEEPETYSSRGPVAHYFGPVVGTTPAAALSTPEEIVKPNVTATDCASTTFFARLRPAGWEFCGTSEAAPHAAAIAALMKQTDPLATPTAIVAAMEASATEFHRITSPNAVGAGMVDALGAITAIGGAPVDDPPSFVVPSLSAEEAEPAPTVSITKKPGPLSKENRPTFEFTSNRPVSFTCQVDGGAPQPCASPYVVPTALGDGEHGFVVTGTDAQGRSGSSGVYKFVVDTKAPKVTIVRHPKKLVRTQKKSIVARFELRASEAPVTFYCQVDKLPLRICGKSFHRRFTPGHHVLKVRAMDQAGNIAAKSTVFRFRVKQVGRRSPRTGG
jgi:hypothetical protein